MLSAFGVEHADISKRAAWKTIDQRQDEVRRDRRWKRRGLQTAGVAGTAGFGLAMKPGSVEDAKDLGEKAKGIKEMHNIKAMDTKTSLNALRGAMFHHKVGTGLLGLGVATGAGLAVAGAARGAEAYHQKGVNDRRRANHAAAQQKKVAVAKSAFGIEHPFDR